jgi:hypothetical protein
MIVVTVTPKEGRRQDAEACGSYDLLNNNRGRLPIKETAPISHTPLLG